MNVPAEGAGKPVRESVSEYAELALPTDANGLGNVLGGKVMHLVDLAGAMAAMRHARKPVVTASIDHMNFLHPIHIGQLIVMHSQVNRVFSYFHGSGRKGDGGRPDDREEAAHLLGLPHVCGAGCARQTRADYAGDS
jgi:hypothetical protein